MMHVATKWGYFWVVSVVLLNTFEKAELLRLCLRTHPTPTKGSESIFQLFPPFLSIVSLHSRTKRLLNYYLFSCFMNRSTIPISQQAAANARQLSCSDNYNTNTRVVRRRRPPAVPPIHTTPPLDFSTSPDEEAFQFQQRYQQHVLQPASSRRPLTAIELAKKNTIDLLLNDNPFTTAGRKIKRRRSICNGYIARQLYNEDDTPILTATPSKQRRRSSGSNASIDSAITDASLTDLLHLQHSYYDLKQRRRHSSHIINSRPDDNEATSSIDTLLNKQRQRHSYHQSHHRRSTGSQSVNTSRVSSANPIFSNNSQYTASEIYPRRLSGIVRLSAAHIALARAKKSKKAHYRHLRWHKWARKLTAMARRVINTRSSEPKETSLPMDELFTLASYIYQMKHGLQGTLTNETAVQLSHATIAEDCDSEDETVSTVVEGNRAMLDGHRGKQQTSKPTMGSLIDGSENMNGRYEQQKSVSSSRYRPKRSPRVSEATVPTIHRRRNRLYLGSLLNIFPFSSLSRIPSFSRSVSENSQLLGRDREPTETDSLLAPSSATLPSYVHPQHQLFESEDERSCGIDGSFKNVQRCTLKWLCNLSHRVIDKLRWHNSEPITQIKFEGWSLFVFSPNSKLRLFLWRIVASRPFEMFMFALLISQWVIMSSVPAIFDTNQTLFDRTADYMLLIIYILYTLEMVFKIVVYGFVLNTHSTVKPTFLSRLRTLIGNRPHPKHVGTTWLTYDMEAQRSSNSALQGIVEDSPIHTGNHQRQRLLPSYAATDYSHSLCTSAAASLKDICSSNRSPSNSSIRSGSLSAISNIINPPGTQNLHSFQTPVFSHTFQELSSIANPNTIFDSADVHPLDNPQKQENTFAKESDVEEVQSKFSDLNELEFQVFASLTPVAPYQPCDTESDVDFLKISHKSFLSNTSNILDFVSIISYWVDVFTLVVLHRRPWPLFQTFAAARLLRLLVITEGSTVIMKSLSSSYEMLKNVLGFFVFFWLLFSLAALFIFMNAFTRRCAVMPEDGRLFQGISNIHYVEPRLSCAGHMISPNTRTGPFDVRTGRQYNHPGTDGFFCKLGQVCIQDTANQPEYGFMSYENIFYSMLNVLTVISTENWTDLLYITQDSVSDKGAAIFYIFCLFLMTFMLVPMFIAVITTAFSHIRGDLRESAFSSKRKAPQLLSGKYSRHKDPSEQRAKTSFFNGNMFGNDCTQRPKTLRGWAQFLSHNTWFQYLGNLFVALHITVMTFYKFDLSPEEKSYLDFYSSIFTVIFALEILLRVYGHFSWKLFWKRNSNRIDFLIVIVSLIDLWLSSRGGYYSNYLAVFAIIRSYRIAYLFPGVLQLLADVVGDRQGIQNLTFFTFLVLLLLAPISVQLFGGDFQFAHANEPTMRFDNSYQAFLAIFQIMTGENWTDILYDAMHSQESSSVTYAALFIVFLYFTVHYIVLNLFIAVIMENFDLDEEEIKHYQIRKYIREHQWKPENFKMDSVSRALLPLFVMQDQKRFESKKLPQQLVAGVTMSKFQEFIADAASADVIGNQAGSSTVHFSGPSRLGNAAAILQRRSSSIQSTETPFANRRRQSVFSQLSNQSLKLDPLPVSYIDYDDISQRKYGDEYELNVAQENKAVILENLQVFRSFVFIKADGAVRQLCIRLLTKKSYNRLMIALIGLSTLLAMWADEMNCEKYPYLTSSVVEPVQTVLLIVYWIDALIHMIADGVFMLPKSYLRSGWNLLDVTDLSFQFIFTVLNISANISGSNRGSNYISYLRILRIWRAVRIVYYIQSMRVIFLDLVYGLPKMIDAITLNVLVFVPFAIYGCYLFSGRFALCNDNTAKSKAECYGEYILEEDGASGILVPRVWKNPYEYSFDTFGQSLLHLFECASGEGWVISLFSAMSVSPGNSDLQPEFSWSAVSVYHSIYYIVFMFVASVCSIQLFIGVFLEIFKQRNGISTLTNTQRQFQDLQRQLTLIKPSLKAERPSANSIRAFFFDLIVDKRGKFAKVMAAVLSVNIVVFATQFSNQPAWLGRFQDIMNALCLCCYVFEILAKILGFGFYKWFFNKWNMYDFLFVTLAILFSISRVYFEFPFGLDVARKIILIGIAFRLAQRNESLDVLFRSFNRALPSIFSVTFVFFIVIICFGVVFQELFSFTRYGSYGNEHANFRSLYSTILTLFRITTGENWDFLMHDFTVEPPECVNEKDCGSPQYAIVLFVIFYVVCTYIFVNLFTVIVIDHFSFTFDKRNQFTLITRTDLRSFKQAWSELDPKATGYIDIRNVNKFLAILDGALSIRVYEYEHGLDALLEASSQFTTDVSRLISIPGSDAKASRSKFKRVNALGDKLFNLYELNKKLSSIDRRVILKRKRQYEEVYQEIKFAASDRGISFPKMLEILAMRLVDVSKSLTFEELVSRARLEDRIANELSTKRAKGLVSMLLQRRRYLKKLSNFSSNQDLNNGNNMELLRSWLTPLSPHPTQNLETSHPFTSAITPSTRGFPAKTSDNNRLLSDAIILKVPKIVVDPARQQSMGDSETILPYSPGSRRQSLLLPTTCNGGSNGILQRRNSSPNVKLNSSAKPTIGSRSNSMCIVDTDILSSSSETSSVASVKSLPEKLLLGDGDPALALLKNTTLSTNEFNSDEHNASENSQSENDDIFNNYCVVDRSIEHMSLIDADRIAERMRDSVWSSLLLGTDELYEEKISPVESNAHEL